MKILNTQELPIRQIFLLCLLLVSFGNCKKKKLAEFHDELWRRESLEMASNLCSKLLECANPIIEKIEPKLQNFTKSQMSSNQCVEKFKKSNVFRLRGENPDLIKEAYRSCYFASLELNCSDLQNGKIQTIDTCNQIKAIQKL